jgi:protein-disulfide isomerase
MENDTSSPSQPVAPSNPYAIPIAILIAGLLVAGAIIYTRSVPSAPSGEVGAPTVAAGDVEKIQPVSSEDHILGSADAAVKIIEFSDLECPFCKRFHSTMQEVMTIYGTDGRAAWVYRHFPLDQLHSKARKAAEASECATELGGNDAFWKYITRYFAVTPSNDQIEVSQFSEIAVDIGLDRNRFDECLASGKYAEKVEAQYRDAVASGGTGTPYTVVIAPNGKKFVIEGAQSLSDVQLVIDAALEETR